MADVYALYAIPNDTAWANEVVVIAPDEASVANIAVAFAHACVTRTEKRALAFHARPSNAPI